MSSATVIQPASKPLNGTIHVPGDKSVSHRAIMFGALALGTTRVENFAPGDDNRSTVEVFRQLGVFVELLDDGVALVHGQGMQSLQPPSLPLDCGNSGTTMRLMSGILSGLGVPSTLIGDDSLQSRPMARVCDPLRSFGANIEALGENQRPPLKISAPTASDHPDTVGFRSGTFHSPVASAQVKSCLLFAALCTQNAFTVHEPSPSRDHTEVMMRAFGVPITSTDHYRDPSLSGTPHVSLPPHTEALQGRLVHVPGDISSAAFLLVAASIVPESSITLSACGFTPTRTGVLDALRRAGVPIRVTHERTLEGGEPACDLVLHNGSGLRPIHVQAAEVPRLVDEIPVLAIYACKVDGWSSFEGVAELRVKETDRLEKTAELVRLCGREAVIDGDVLRVRGDSSTPLQAFTYNPEHDHRMAAAAIVAAQAADGPCTVENTACLSVSYPGLLEDLQALGAS